MMGGHWAPSPPTPYGMVQAPRARRGMVGCPAAPPVECGVGLVCCYVSEREANGQYKVRQSTAMRFKANRINAKRRNANQSNANRCKPRQTNAKQSNAKQFEVTESKAEQCPQSILVHCR